MRQRRVLTLAALAFASLTALASTARAETHNVTVSSFQFDPSVLTIAPGDTVVWTNVEGSHDVVADNGSFAGPFGSGWTYSRTFGEIGTFGYYCSPHGGPGGAGMSGTIIVQSSGEQRGAFRFSLAAYSVPEGGTATVIVQRVGGDDGTVSVRYSVAAGSASGSDFTPANGTLTWANNDDDPKSFTVATTNDSTSEPNETIQLNLSLPTGGATVGSPSTATLTIQDNDANPGQIPSVPTGLQAMAHGPDEIMLNWTDASNNETGFIVEARQVGGTFQTVGTVGANTTTATITGLEPATFYLFRVRAQGSGGTTSAPSNQVGIATLGEVAPCVAGPITLCMNGGRFRAQLDWRTSESFGNGKAVPVPSAPDSGLFYFFTDNNLEMLIKVLNGCGINNRYWVFYAATTNVEFAVVVTDTLNGRTAAYFNPLDTPAPPVQDTSAFPSCP
jgi:plastocyanin